MTNQNEEFNPIKDSGSRTIFDSGANRDSKENNGRIDLMPEAVVADLCDYAPNNAYVKEREALLMRGTDDYGRCTDDFKYNGNTDALIRAMYEFIIGKEIFLDEYKKLAAELGCEIDVNAITAKQIVSATMIPLSVHFKNGTLKYGERNWEKGIPLHSYIDSSGRHYHKINAGFMDEPHHLAVLWNLMCAIWTYDNLPKMNDLPCGKKLSNEFK